MTHKLFENTAENRLVVAGILSNSVIEIRFKKRDGSIRDMLATLNDDFIKYDVKGGRATPSSSQAVWDIKEDSWRSFRWDSLLSYTS